MNKYGEPSIKICDKHPINNLKLIIRRLIKTTLQFTCNLHNFCADSSKKYLRLCDLCECNDKLLARFFGIIVMKRSLCKFLAGTLSDSESINCRFSLLVHSIRCLVLWCSSGMGGGLGRLRTDSKMMRSSLSFAVVEIAS